MSLNLPRVGFADPQPLTPRQRLEAEIERLIALLDDFDGDADVEPNGDEEDQSYPEGSTFAGQFYLEDDEDATDAEARAWGRNIVTLNPPPVPTKRIRRTAR